MPKKQKNGQNKTYHADNWCQRNDNQIKFNCMLGLKKRDLYGYGGFILSVCTTVTIIK